MTICEENRHRIDTIERSHMIALERRLAEAEKSLIASVIIQTQIVGDIAYIVASLAQTPHVDRKMLREVQKHLGTALVSIKPLTNKCCGACKDGD